MSIRLIDLAKELLTSHITADEFETKFLEVWRKEGKSGQLTEYSQDIADCAAEIFILVDCYTSESDRRESELDSDGLKKEVKETLEKFNFI